MAKTKAKKPEYKHSYSITKCPYCGRNLTSPNSVVFDTSDGDRTTGSYLTHLTNDGTIVDVDYMIASGLHSGTSCACGEYLDDYENL